jgi:hypothetical protein
MDRRWALPLALGAATALYFAWRAREGFESAPRYERLQQQTIDIDRLREELEKVQISQERMRRLSESVDKNDENTAAMAELFEREAAFDQM